MAACKLPLAPARVLSIASHTNAKNLHARWPIRAPTFRLRQSERHIPAAPIRTHALLSRLSGQSRILTHFDSSRLHTHASRNITSKTVFFQYNISSPLLCLWPSCHSLLGLTTSHFISIPGEVRTYVKRPHTAREDLFVFVQFENLDDGETELDGDLLYSVGFGEFHDGGDPVHDRSSLLLVVVEKVPDELLLRPATWNIWKSI